MHYVEIKHHEKWDFPFSSLVLLLPVREKFAKICVYWFFYSKCTFCVGDDGAGGKFSPNVSCRYYGGRNSVHLFSWHW